MSHPMIARSDRMVYIRPVGLEELPDDVRAQVPGTEALYAVCSEEGERLALVRDKRLAYILARQNDFVPMSVH